MLLGAIESGAPLPLSGFLVGLGECLDAARDGLKDDVRFAAPALRDSGTQLARTLGRAQGCFEGIARFIAECDQRGAQTERDGMLQKRHEIGSSLAQDLEYATPVVYAERAAHIRGCRVDQWRRARLGAYRGWRGSFQARLWL